MNPFRGKGGITNRDSGGDRRIAAGARQRPVVVGERDRSTIDGAAGTRHRDPDGGGIGSAWRGSINGGRRESADRGDCGGRCRARSRNGELPGANGSRARGRSGVPHVKLPVPVRSGFLAKHRVQCLDAGWPCKRAILVGAAAFPAVSRIAGKAAQLRGNTGVANSGFISSSAGRGGGEVARMGGAGSIVERNVERAVGFEGAHAAHEDQSLTGRGDQQEGQVDAANRVAEAVQFHRNPGYGAGQRVRRHINNGRVDVTRHRNTAAAG